MLEDDFLLLVDRACPFPLVVDEPSLLLVSLLFEVDFPSLVVALVFLCWRKWEGMFKRERERIDIER